jgi:FixJ family two-component response regulator
MSGLDLQQELNSRNSTIPVIMITAHGDMAMAVRAIKAGALDCLAKPFQDQDLLDRVHEAIELDAERRRVRSRHDQLSARIAALRLKDTRLQLISVASGG